MDRGEFLLKVVAGGRGRVQSIAKTFDVRICRGKFGGGFGLGGVEPLKSARDGREFFGRVGGVASIVGGEGMGRAKISIRLVEFLNEIGDNGFVGGPRRGQFLLGGGDALVEHTIKFDDVVDLSFEDQFRLTQNGDRIRLVGFLLQNGILEFEDADLGADEFFPDVLDELGFLGEFPLKTVDLGRYGRGG